MESSNYGQMHPQMRTQNSTGNTEIDANVKFAFHILAQNKIRDFEFQASFNVNSQPNGRIGQLFVLFYTDSVNNKCEGYSSLNWCQHICI